MYRVDRAAFEQQLIRRVNRRRLLMAGGGLLVATSLRGGPTRTLGAFQATPVATPALGSNPFTLGVGSGDPLPDSVVLWTRLALDPVNGGGMAAAPVEVRWEIADDDAFSSVVQSGTATARPELAHSVHVDAANLRPGATYFYRFMAGGEVSPVGRTRTAPAADAVVDRLRFAFASCSHYEDGYFAAYRHMADEELDLVAHLGDYIYEGGTASEEDLAAGDAVRLHNGDEILTLEAYRDRYGLYRSDPDLQRLHAAAPWIVTWDDHEVDNDYADDREENGAPAELFLERRAAAYQAYYEHQALRPESMPMGPTLQLYRKLSWGSLAELVVLDTRQYRTDHPCGEGAQVRCPAAIDPSTTMLGPQQEQWLLSNLDASTAGWNVLVQSLQMGELEQSPGPGETYWNDSWPGYPAARARILNHMMTRQIANPVVISGDIHCSWGIDLNADFRDPASQTIATEFIGPSISSEANSTADFFTAYLEENPHVRYFDPRRGGYVLCEVTPDAWRSDYRLVETATVADSPISTVASFVVESGNPGVETA